MSKVIRVLAQTISVAAVLALSACASQFRSEVQSFHKLAAASNGETFRIVPADPAKQGSLEFESYASLVRAELVRLGYKPVNAANAADIDVALGYSISEPVEKVESRPGFGFANSAFGPYGFGGFGYGGIGYGYYGRGHYSRLAYDPFFSFNSWNQPEIYSYSVYTRKLNLTMTRATSKEQLYDGKVESSGKDGRLPELMPYLVQSMFQTFPGQSGVTRKVVIELPRS